MSKRTLLLVLGTVLVSQASSATLSDILVRKVGATTQVVLVSDSPVLYREMLLKEPHRILLDLTGLASALPRNTFPAIDRGGIVRIDVSKFRKTDLLRVTVELNGNLPYTIFSEENNLTVSLATGDETNFQEWKASEAPPALVREASNPGPSNPGPGPEATLAAPTLPPPPVMAPPEQFVSMDLEDADILTVLRGLSEYSGRDIVAGPEVTGKITMSLHSVPWRRALDLVVKTAGFAYVEEADVIRVTTPAKLAQERTALEAAEDLVHRVYKLEFAVPTEIATTVKRVLSSRGSVETDVRTNSVVVTDITSTQEAVAKMVALLDSPTPQVEIAVKVVDIDYTASKRLGIDWRVTGLRSRTYNLRADSLRSVMPGDLVAGFGTFSVGTARSLARIDATLRALEDEGKSETIANPRVTVVNNRNASIMGGKKFSIVVFDQRGNAITQLYSVGTKLDVTPNINSLDEVTMDIRSELSEVDEATVAAGRPVMTTSEAQTRQLVRDGETVVLGGFIREKRSKTVTGIPLLRSIPLIGALFRETATAVAKREVLIFLTPNILKKQGSS